MKSKRAFTASPAPPGAAAVVQALWAEAPLPAATPLSLVLFTRLPQAGHAKTRLIPVLGAEGAAELQRKMTRLAVARAWAFCAAAPGRRLVIAYDGGSGSGGVARTFLCHQHILLAHSLGAKPASLASARSCPPARNK